MENLGYCIKPLSCDNKTFNIVVPSYNHGTKLEVIINSMLSQTCDQWALTIVSDGQDDIQYRKIVDRYIEHPNISFFCTLERYNDWGHTPREYGMRQTSCEWTIMTGYDNYYMPTFIEEFFKVHKIYENASFIYCDFVLNHVRNGRPYNGYISSKLEVNFIDIGNFALKNTILREIGFPFREYAADWKLVETAIPLILERDELIVKIPQTLYVHN